MQVNCWIIAIEFPDFERFKFVKGSKSVINSPPKSTSLGCTVRGDDNGANKTDNRLA